MFPILLVAIGIAVLLLGKRLAVLGAAVGAILGVALLSLLQSNASIWIQLLVVGGLAALGFFVAGFAKGIISIVLLVFGALGGAAIVLAFLNLFNVDLSLLTGLLVFVGGVAGLILIQRFRDWGMILLSAVIGALLVVRGLTIWLPSLDGTFGTLIVLVLAAASVVYQGGFLNRGKSGGQTPTAA